MSSGKLPDILSDFNQIWISSHKFYGSQQYQISSQWEPS
jgi:hypothetical protein